MRVIRNKHRMRLTEAARGIAPCDLAIDNVQLVNVITGEIYPVTGVDIYDGVIVRVRMNGEEVNAYEHYDGKGNYLVPGFIDCHMHIESTMMIPENFGKAAVLWGTTTAVTDPHEIANVMGLDGVFFMLDSAEKSPLRIYTLTPSCVPAVPAVESAGASFDSYDIMRLLEEEKVIGVAEIMDYLGVINNDERMVTIIDEGEAANSFLQGHCPGLSGSDLCAYLCGGPVSDHEAREAEELKEKLRMGMHINIKSSSLSDTVTEFIKGIKDIPVRDYVSLCTDDVHAADLLTTGHINHIVNVCIEGGIDPIEAIRFGTINAARELRFEDCGAIAPGYVADLQIVRDLQFKDRPVDVFVAGKRITPELTLTNNSSYSPKNTVNIPQIKSAESFYIPSRKGEQHLIFSAARANMRPNQPLKYEEFPIENGHIVIPDLNKYQFISIVNRYGNGNMTTLVCSDFHLNKGCIASTISHDSHNMTIVFRDQKDAYVAATELERIGGGMCYVEDGEVKYSLPLPYGGLMSDLEAEALAPRIKEMEDWVLHACDDSMLLAIAILALPVRPGIIITDKGVVRGETLEFVPTRLAM